MDLQKKLSEINSRWQIDDGYSEEEEFRRFKTRIMNSFSGIDSRVTKKSIADFCNVIGIEEKWDTAMYEDSSWSTNIKDALNNESNPKKFFRLLEIILALEIPGITNRYGGPSYSKSFFFNKIDEAINYSKVNISIVKTENDIIIYPSGEKILDKEVVNKTLSFLKDKPGFHFIDALKFYDKNTPESRVKSSNSLRRCLEEFFRTLLNNNAGLKANIGEIGNALKSKNVNNDIRNCVTTIISRLDHPIFNNNSKHQDGDLSELENEFMIYQVALLMKYIHKAFNG